MKSSLALLAALALFVPANWAATFEIRLGSGEKDLSRYQEYGSTITMVGDLGKLATYSEVAPGCITLDSPLGQQIAHNREAFLKDCAAAAQAGLEVCISTDEVTIPRAVFSWFKTDFSRDGKPDALNLDNDKFWDVYRAKYREVLHAFPAIAYVMIRTGENYANRSADYMGHTVVEHEIDDQYFQRMQRLINETRSVVVDECGRKLIWRTWDLGNDGFHANPRVYDRVLAGVRNHEGLIIAVKHVQTDFWRYNDFNPNIGRSGVDQIVEFQCAREYEGKGAFPNYLGALFATDLRRCRDLHVKGIWLWDFGGGSGGPKLKNDRWVRANIYAASQLADDPDRDPQDLAVAWATTEFGAKAAPRIADLLMLSSECVRKMVYVEPYALQHKGWMPSRGLMRDDIIRGERRMALHGGLDLIYEGSRDEFDAALQEKQDAVDLAKRMLQLYDEAKPAIVADRGEATFNEARSSLVYLESLAEVMAHYIRGMFLFYRSQETHDAPTAQRAKTELTQWRAAWQHYNKDIPKLPGAPSLYRSQYGPDASTSEGAMVDTCEKALKKLAAK
jgi:hypothetical protein